MNQKKLGFGLMRLPSLDENDPSKIDLEETKKMVQSASPTDSGGYKKGWTAKKIKDSASKTEVVVYNRSKPGLTHLLEKGHAKRGGGRVEAKVHIAPAESYAISQLEDKIVKGLK